MPRAKIPSYRLHKASGQARVILNGKHHYLGLYGSEQSRRRYTALLDQQFADVPGVPKIPPAVAAASSGSSRLLVNELLVQYLVYADSYYVKNGRPTGEATNVRAASRPLRSMYGNSFADEFGPKALKQVRQHMIEVEDLARKVINNRVDCIKRIFRWGVSEELLPAGVDQALRTVAGLRSGRSNARETLPVGPVPDASVETTLKFLPSILVDMVKLQRLTGMRSGSLVIMRPCDVDRSSDVWVYEPADHKTLHHGKKLLIFLGPQAQAILLKYLNRPDGSYLFSPREVRELRQAQRRLQPPSRRSPLYPSEVRRVERQKEVRRSRRGERPPGERYDPASYRRAIRYAIKKAMQNGLSIPSWHPHQLRHNRATEIRKGYGLEGAQVVLGHASASITEIYAARDADFARQIAEKTG